MSYSREYCFQRVWIHRSDLKAIVVAITPEQAIKLLQTRFPSYLFHEEHLQELSLNTPGTYLINAPARSAQGEPKS